MGRGYILSSMARALQTEYTGATYHLLHVGEWVGCQVYWGGGGGLLLAERWWGCAGRQKNLSPGGNWAGAQPEEDQEMLGGGIRTESGKNVLQNS